jgi:CheY-like chemotaxis protein
MALGGFIETLPATVVSARDGDEALTRPTRLTLTSSSWTSRCRAWDGLEAIRQLKAAPKTARTPIIALTAQAMPGDRECCLEARASAYEAKPVSLPKPLKLIGSLTERQRKPMKPLQANGAPGDRSARLHGPGSWCRATAPDRERGGRYLPGMPAGGTGNCRSPEDSPDLPDL